MTVVRALPGALEQRVAALFYKRKANQTPEVMAEARKIAAEKGCAQANAFLASKRLTKQRLVEMIVEAGLNVLEAENGNV